jgi:hypothetical protein
VETSRPAACEKKKTFSNASTIRQSSSALTPPITQTQHTTGTVASSA